MKPEITNTFILNVNDRRPSFIFIIQIYIEMIFKCLVCHAWHPPTQFLKHKLFQYHCFNGFYGTNWVQQSVARGLVLTFWILNNMQWVEVRTALATN